MSRWLSRLSSFETIRRLLAVALASALIVAVSCVPAAAIIGGQDVVVSGVSPVPAVVKIEGWHTDYHLTKPPTNYHDHCTGTVVAPSWILTAQHCTNVGEKPGKPYTNGEMKVFVRRGPNNAATTYKVSAIHRMPGYAQGEGIQDLALMRLESSVLDVTPMPLLDGAAFAGLRQVDRYGYGKTSRKNTDPSYFSRRSKERVYTWTEAAGLTYASCGGSGGGSGGATWGQQNALFTSPIDGGAAQGDSGGPAFADIGGGKLAIAGVTQGARDRALCGAGNDDPVARKATYLGTSNRVDSASFAWTWLKGVVPALKTAAPPPPPVTTVPAVPPTTTPPTTTPPAPTKPSTVVVSLSNRTTNSISLSWTRSPGATGYRVYEGSAVKKTTTDPTTVATIGDLASDTPHTYQVKAFNNAGDSPPSNAITARTLQSYIYSFKSQRVTNPDGSNADLAHARPGQPFTVSIEVNNTGTASWSRSGTPPVLLGTVRPNDRASQMRDDDWISPTRPARLQGDVAKGAVGTFVFHVKAPASAGTVTDHFSLVAEGAAWFNDAGLSVTITTVPIVGTAARPGTNGHWNVASDGGVFTENGAPFFGSKGGQALNAPIAAMAATKSGEGYWLVGADGGVFAYGDAAFAGSMAGKPLNRPVVAIAGTPSGQGYWLAGADGGVFAYGDAPFLGSMGGKPLNAGIVGIASTPSGQGYWLAGADGGVFAYGDAQFSGSMVDKPLNKPIVGIASDGTPGGYFLVGGDGGIYAYGSARFLGSAGGSATTRPTVGMSVRAAGYFTIDNGGAGLFYDGTISAPPAPPPPPPPAPAEPTTLSGGQTLGVGARLISGDGQYALVMQGDGNLVEYAPGNRAVWASGTGEPGTVLINQSDGNIVLVAPGGRPVWATGTNGNPDSVLIVQNDANIVVYAPGNRPVWASGTRP